MNINYSKVLRRIASLGYSAGVVSLIIGVLLSVINQPVYASSQNGSNHKVWICHVPPGNSGNARAINVDVNGWNGHNNHGGDFQISGPNDPRCGGDDDDPTKTPKPTKSQEPTEVKETETKEPTEVKVTKTYEPTVVKGTETREPTEVKETETKEPTEVKETETKEPTEVNETPTVTSTDIPTATATEEPTSTPTNAPTATATATNTDEPTLTATATETEEPTATATEPSEEVSFRRLSVDWQCVEGQQLWTITNPNGFALAASWLFSSGAGPGSATIPANSSINFYVAGGYRTITVSWTDPGGTSHSLNRTTSVNSPCAVNDPNTPTPDPGGDPTSTPTTQGTTVVTSRLSDPKPTFVATLEATLDPSQELLIPVTGADFSNPFTNTPLSKLLVNLGFIFFGMALLSHGISSKLK